MLRKEVLDAFEVLKVPPDVDEATASRAYKKLALLHHPDRNKGDTASTARFQEVCYIALSTRWKVTNPVLSFFLKQPRLVLHGLHVLVTTRTQHGVRRVEQKNISMSLTNMQRILTMTMTGMKWTRMKGRISLSNTFRMSLRLSLTSA